MRYIVDDQTDKRQVDSGFICSECECTLVSPRVWLYVCISHHAVLFFDTTIRQTELMDSYDCEHKMIIIHLWHVTDMDTNPSIGWDTLRRENCEWEFFHPSAQCP